MPHPHPPAPQGLSPQLRAELERAFGSPDGFRRTLERMRRIARGSDICLVCTRDGRLRLVPVTPERAPVGRILLCVPARGAPPPPPDWRALSDDYRRHMQRRPPYPMP